jgi:rare lipoprotein A
MMLASYSRLCLIALSLLLIQACSTAPSGRYSQKQDSAPQFEYGELSFVEPTPTYEPYNVWTSRPYTVLGGYYTPLQSGKGYEEEGYASWYGQKFHGHTTANGETFDMFALTAAHKTLPLPSFLRVTNLENNKSTTVRVNDRGPFHDDRILDLSYGAAKKLDFHSKGVTRVKVEIVHVTKDGIVTIGNNTQSETLLASTTVSTAPAPRILTSSVADGAMINNSSTSQIRETIDQAPQLTEESLEDPLLFVQVTASSDGNKVQDLASGLSNLLQVPNNIPKLDNVYRLHLGPIENEQSAKKLILSLQKIGFENAFQVEFNPR